MSFALAEAFVEIKADPRHYDAGSASVKSDIKSIPGLKVVGIKADTSGFSEGIARARHELEGLERDARGRYLPKGVAGVASARPQAAGYDLAGEGSSYGIAGENASHARPTLGSPSRPQPFPTLDTSAVTAQIAEVRSKLIKLGNGSTVRLRIDSVGLAAGLTRAREGLSSLPGMKVVRIVGDATGISAAVASAKSKLASIDFKAFGAAAVGGFAAQITSMAIPEIINGFRAGVMGASDLAESIQKVEIVFGASAEKLKGFSTQMADAFGSSRVEILDAAANFGLMGKAAGMSKDAAAGLAVNLARLADDASSFYNVPLDVALEKIRSGLAGEALPMRDFGVLLSEDAVKAEAFRLGIAKTNRELTDQQKVMARASLIQKGMADAQGDHARTAGSFANQWREFTGRVFDLAVTVGGVALPMLNGFLAVLNPIATALQAIAAEIGKVIGGLGRMAGAVSKGVLGENIFAGAGAVPPAPGGGVGKALPPTAAGGPPGGVKYGIEAARKEVAADKAKADQDRLTQKVRDEVAAAQKLASIDRQNAALHKALWVEATAAELRSKTNTLVLTKGQIEDAFGRAKVDAEKLYTTKFGGKSAADAPKADSTAARNGIEAAWSMLKEKAQQAVDLHATVKQQGLGLIGKGAEAIVDMGEPERRKREKREGYQTEFLGGREMSQRIQSAALGDENRKEEKEMAKNTAQTVFELKNLIEAVKGTAKQAARTLAAYG